MRVRRSDHAAIGRLLMMSVTDGECPSPRSLDELLGEHRLADLPRMAALHGVAGLVQRRLRGRASLPVATARALEVEYHHGLRQHVQAMADLSRVGPVLDGLGVPWLVVKGPVLSVGLYARPDLRGYSDLDVVVPASALRTVLKALQSADASLVDRKWVLRGRGIVGEVDLALPYGTPLDLHWHLLNEPALRTAFDIPMPELFERARTIRLQATRVRTLDPVDTLVYQCVHSCLSGGNRLIWIKDVERALAVEAPPWDAVVDRARQWKVGLAVAQTLSQARRLSADVPDEVLRTLAPSRSWTGINRLALGVWPVERSTGGVSPARLLARSVRRDARSSAMEVGRSILAGVSRRSPLRPRVAADGTAPPGSEAELSAFLEAVESTTNPGG